MHLPSVPEARHFIARAQRRPAVRSAVKVKQSAHVHRSPRSVLSPSPAHRSSCSPSPFRPAATSRARSNSWSTASTTARCPDPARRDRLRQDLHHGQRDRAPGPPGDRVRAQQDAGGAAVFRVPRVLPEERGRVLRQLLRLLPARGLYRSATCSSRRTARSTSISSRCACPAPRACSSGATS